LKRKFHAVEERASHVHDFSPGQLSEGGLLLPMGAFRIERHDVEERRKMWAKAEVCWKDQSGAVRKLQGTIEDMSRAGACIRVRTAIALGTNLTIKWHVEQFSAVARNSRRDGAEFLVGIQRTTSLRHIETRHPEKELMLTEPAALPALPDTSHQGSSQGADVNGVSTSIASAESPATLTADIPTSTSEPSSRPSILESDGQNTSGPDAVAAPRLQAKDSSLRQEREIMSTTFLTKFWRAQQDAAPASGNTEPADAPMNKSDIDLAGTAADSKSGLLLCEDIYRASGILSVRAKYDITKIVEMLNSKHIRELAKEVKRASVLMALDAAGTSVDEVLHDATRRQHALNSYETGQQRQFEEFEAGKERDNAQIKVEMERVTAHYQARIQNNLDQVAREREAFHNWQEMKEQESQRIAEAVALCGKQPIESPRDPQLAIAKAAAVSSTSGNATQTQTQTK
jgi:hypothetical protein